MPNFKKIKFHKIIQSESYTALILNAENKQFAIYTEPHVSKQIQATLSQTEKSRPTSQNLIQNILLGYEGTPFQVLIYNMENSIYFTKLFLETKKDDEKVILEIDSRPSDSLTIAILYDIPIYCKEEVLAKIPSLGIED